jgi:hypothetical protein
MNHLQRLCASCRGDKANGLTSKELDHIVVGATNKAKIASLKKDGTCKAACKKPLKKVTTRKPTPKKESRKKQTRKQSRTTKLALRKPTPKKVVKKVAKKAGRPKKIS